MLLTGYFVNIFPTQIFLSILALLLGFWSIVQLQLLPLFRSYLQGTVLGRPTKKHLECKLDLNLDVFSIAMVTYMYLWPWLFEKRIVLSTG